MLKITAQTIKAMIPLERSILSEKDLVKIGCEFLVLASPISNTLSLYEKAIEEIKEINRTHVHTYEEEAYARHRIFEELEKELDK